MANWLDKIQEVLSIKSVEDQLDRNSALFGEEGSWGNAIGDVIQAPLYGVTKGVGAIGAGIGGAAGLVGGAMSEAGQEAMEEGRSKDVFAATGAGAKGGAEAGYDAAQENVTVLDLASLGAGAGAGLAMRGAGAAGAVGNLGKAASLAKTAGALSKADLALSGVDAGMGVNDVVTGVKEGDWAKAAMGIARVAGNTYGAKNAFGDLTKAKGFGSAAEELADVASKPDVLGLGDSLLDTTELIKRDPFDLPTDELRRSREILTLKRTGPDGLTDDEFEFLADAERALDTRKSPDLDMPRPVGRGTELEEVADAVDSGVKVRKQNDYQTKAMIKDRNGDHFTIEHVVEGDEKVQPGFKPSKDFEAKKAERHEAAVERIEELKSDPEIQEVYANGATFIRQVQKAVEERFYGGMARRAETLMKDLGNLPKEAANQLYLQGKRFLGFTFGGTNAASTFVEDTTKAYRLGKNAKTVKLNQYPGGAFYVNAPLTADIVSRNFEGFLDPTLKNFDVAGEMLDETTLSMIKGLRDGTIARTPEIELEIKSRMFARSLVYSVFHESGGHAASQSRHAAVGKGDYRRGYMGEKGVAVRSHNQNVPLPTDADTISKVDTFAHAQNEIAQSMRMMDTEYPELKALLDSPSVQQQMKRFYMVSAPYEDVDRMFKVKTEIKTDRPIGTKEAKAAAKEFRNRGMEAGDEPAPRRTSREATREFTALREQARAEIDEIPKDLPQDEYGRRTDAIGEKYAAEFDRLNEEIDVLKAQEMEEINAIRQQKRDDLITEKGMTRTAEETDALDAKNAMTRTAEETDALDARNQKVNKEIARKKAMGAKHGEQTVWERPTPAAEPPRFGKQIDPALADEPLRPLAERIKMAFAEQRRINRINLEKNNAHWHAKMQAEEAVWGKYNSGQISEEELFKSLDELRKGRHGLITETLGMRLDPEEFRSVMATIQEQTVKNTEEKNNLAISWKKMVNGERLEPGEVERLSTALKSRVAEERSNNFFTRFLKTGENLIGGSRALMSSMDLSAAGRQALYASVMNPKEAARAFKTQIDALKMTPEQFETFMKTLSDPDHNPFAELSNAAGLHITGPHEIGGKVEEAFLNPTWAEKIPGVRRTEQAYIAYLNKMRVELFNKGADTLMDAGIPHFDDMGKITQAYKDLAYMVNTLTGRGEMSLMHISPTSRVGKAMGLTEELAPGEKTMNQMHRALTSVFFAPRFTASRAAILRDSTMALLGGNLDPKVHKMYMKNVYGTYAAQMGVVGMLVGTGLATFQADPRKPDFGNLKVGNVRYDIFAGIKQWAKLFTVIGTDKYLSKTYGWREYGDGMGAKTKTGEVGKFMQGKLSPPAGFLLEALTGEDFLGRKSNMLRNAYGHMFPMILQTVGEVIEAGEADQLAIAVPAASLGIGVNAYKPTRGGGWKR